jgi:N-acetylmuramoyl-L-alanine amidase
VSLALLLAPPSSSDSGPGSASADGAVERFDLVVLDAGHGGEDLGAQGRDGVLEKDLVLDVARRLRARLVAAGIRVVMTRDDDRTVALERRTAIANDARGDLFLSIHANAAPARSARGIETYFLSLEASDDAARTLAQRENSAFGENGTAMPAGADPLASIFGDLIATEYLVESDEFARIAEKELTAVDTAPSRGVKQAPFVVLMGVQMPASLVEIGFLTNAAEERTLGREEHRDRIADALARAVVAFGRRYDARRGVGQLGGR